MASRQLVQTIPDALASQVVFSRDGSLLTAGSFGAFALLWDVSAQKEVRRFSCPVYVKAVCFSHDESRLVTTDADVAASVGTSTGVTDSARWQLRPPNTKKRSN